MARIVAQTAAWGVASQAVTAFVQFVALGLLIRAVGREQFGLWMVVYAIAMWTPMLLFGQSNIILTRLGQAIFADFEEARRVLTSSLVVCLFGAGAALVMLFALVPFVPWRDWLHIQNARIAGVALPTMLAAVTVAILAVPASLSSFSMLASRRGVLNHQIMIAAQCVCLAVFILGIWAHWPLWALGAINVAPLGTGGIVLFVMGMRKGYFPRPDFSSVERESIKKTLRLALTIFTFDVATVLLQRTPELIVVRLRGINEVAALAAASRLSLVLFAIIQAILMAIWPMISEAAGRNDWHWVKRAFIGSLGVIFLIWGSGAASIWFLGPFFVEKWTGISNLVSGALFMAIILQALSLGLLTWIFTGLSALSMYKTQLVAAAGAVFIYFASAPIFGQPWGAVGVVLAQSSGILLFALPVGLLALLRRMWRIDPGASRRSGERFRSLIVGRA